MCFIPAVGERPLGWYTGRNSVNTARLVAEEGGFVYHADSYSDDLPYFETGKRGKGAGGDGATPMVVVPYTFDINDQKFVRVRLAWRRFSHCTPITKRSYPGLFDW